MPFLLCCGLFRSTQNWGTRNIYSNTLRSLEQLVFASKLQLADFFLSRLRSHARNCASRELRQGQGSQGSRGTVLRRLTLRSRGQRQRSTGWIVVGKPRARIHGSRLPAAQVYSTSYQSGSSIEPGSSTVVRVLTTSPALTTGGVPERIGSTVCHEDAPGAALPPAVPGPRESTTISA